jgi:hypothetical protein
MFALPGDNEKTQGALNENWFENTLDAAPEDPTALTFAS